MLLLTFYYDDLGERKLNLAHEIAIRQLIKLCYID